MYKTIHRLLKKRYFLFILITVFTFAVIGEMYHYLIVSKSKSLMISLNYPGAEKGLNPDGSRFNISELTSDEILNDAKANLKMKNQSNDSIRNSMNITTEFAQSEIEEVVADIQRDSETSYVPTTFYLRYTQRNKLKKNESFEFLSSLAESYETYFNKNHAENNSLLIFDEDSYDFSNYDYSEIYNILCTKADKMLDLLNGHYRENRAFRVEDNLNLGTVKDKLSNFRNVELEKFGAYIVQNNISKNRGIFINKLQYLMDKAGISYRKNRQASDIAKAALEKYDPNITAVAFIPSVDNSRSFYMSRTKTGIDDLAKKSYEDGMEAARISKKTDSYNNNYQKLTGAADTSGDMLSYTEQYLKKILDTFSDLSETIVELDKEYLEYKTEDYFTYEIDKKSSPVNFTMILKFMLLGFLMSLIIVIYMEFMYGIIHRKATLIKRALLIMTKYRKRIG